MFTVAGTCTQEYQQIVLWKIPAFLSLLDCKTSPGLECEQMKADGNLQIRLRLCFDGTHDFVKIYYTTSSTVYMTRALLKMYANDDAFELVAKVYDTVFSNKLTYLSGFSRSEIVSNVLQESATNVAISIEVRFGMHKIFRDVFNPRLNSDMKRLFDNELYADATVTSSDDVEFKVHKAVLASRSEVFKAMLEYKKLEDQTDKLKTHLDAEVLREVLNYIYTDDISLLSSMPHEILAAADYYQLDRLKILSEEALSRKLTVDNAIVMLETAEKYSAGKLKQSVLEFIKNGQLKYVLKTIAWDNIKCVDFLKSILEYVHGED